MGGGGHELGPRYCIGGDIYELLPIFYCVGNFLSDGVLE